MTLLFVRWEWLMAQLFFKYGAMNSGKSIDLLKTAHNYLEQNKNVVIFTPSVDTRDDVNYVSSRIKGLRQPATVIYDHTNLYQHVLNQGEKTFCVLVDEAQFLTKKSILELTQIVDQLNIPVITFGLKNDFQNHLFEGSKELLVYADKIEEIKTICWFCNKKATMNLRIKDGKPIYEGDQIQIGGNESYYPVCRHCYFHPKIGD